MENVSAIRNVSPAFQPGKMKVAYIVSRFPKLTETFVLYEMVAMEQCGIQVELYPLMRERTNVFHPEAKPFMARAHFQPLLSWSIIKANLAWLGKHPRRYIGALVDVIRGTLHNYKQFPGALGSFPKSAYFASQMAAEGVTHIHAHFARQPATAAFVIHRLTGIPYSFTAHGSDVHRAPHMLREKVAEARFVVPISNFNRQVILDACQGQFAEKMKVIHVGVDTHQAFQPRRWENVRPIRSHGLNQSHGLDQSHEPFSFVCIGTLHEVKGQAYLIEACKLLEAAGHDFVCHLVGDGPDRAALEKLAQSCTPGRIRFHGQITRPEILQLLQSVDLAVTPSVPTRDGRKEGIPTVLMEAMASGLPVVASRLSGIPELVEDGINGYLVAPRDVNGLSQAIESVLLNPERGHQLGAAGRLKVEQEFDLHQNAACLAALF